MTLLNRRAREVYRVFDEDELAEQSSWLDGQETDTTSSEDAVPESHLESPRRVAPPAMHKRSLSVIGTLLVGALAGLIVGLVIVRGGHAPPGSSSPTQAPGSASSISAARADAASRGVGPRLRARVDQPEPDSRADWRIAPLRRAGAPRPEPPRRASTTSPSVPDRSSFVAKGESQRIEPGPRDADAEFDFER